MFLWPCPDCFSFSWSRGPSHARTTLASKRCCQIWEFASIQVQSEEFVYLMHLPASGEQSPSTLRTGPSRWTGVPCRVPPCKWCRCPQKDPARHRQEDKSSLSVFHEILRMGSIVALPFLRVFGNDLPDIGYLHTITAVLQKANPLSASSLALPDSFCASLHASCAWRHETMRKPGISPVSTRCSISSSACTALALSSSVSSVESSILGDTARRTHQSRRRQLHVGHSSPCVAFR